MAVAYDATATGNVNPGTEVSYSHTVGSGINRVLLVGITTNATTDKLTGPTPVTYGGVTMTRLASAQAHTTNFFGYIYYLLNPTSGAANVVITLDDSQTAFAISNSYSGVNQGAPATFATGTDAAGNFDAALTTIVNNAWIAALARSNNGTSGITAGTNTTIRTGSSEFFCFADTNAAQTPAGAKTMGFNANPGGETFWITVALDPISIAVSDTAVVTDAITVPAGTNAFTVSDTADISDDSTVKYGFSNQGKSSTTWTNQNKS